MHVRVLVYMCIHVYALVHVHGSSACQCVGIPLLECKCIFIISDVYMFDTQPVVNAFINVGAKLLQKYIFSLCQLLHAAERPGTNSTVLFHYS